MSYHHHITATIKKLVFLAVRQRLRIGCPGVSSGEALEAWSLLPPVMWPLLPEPIFFPHSN